MDKENEIIPRTATVFRTAKRLLEGNVFWVDGQEADLKTDATYSSNGRHSLGLAFVLEHKGESSSHLFESDSQQHTREEESQQEVQEEEETNQKAQHEDEKTAAPPQLSHKPLRASSEVPSLPTHPNTPLTSAIQQLHAHLTHLLSDPELSTRSYPSGLLNDLEYAYRKIKEKSQERIPCLPTHDWNKWAKDVRRRNRSGMENEKAAMEAKAARGTKKGRRKEHGLTRSGELMWDRKSRVSNPPENEPDHRVSSTETEETGIYTPVGNTPADTKARRRGKKEDRV
jgi:hypothetical protein